MVSRGVLGVKGNHPAAISDERAVWRSSAANSAGISDKKRQEKKRHLFCTKQFYTSLVGATCLLKLFDSAV